MYNINNYNKFDRKSINEILEKVNNNHRIMLPAIQRKFVWNEEKILKFIDSILIGYPIGMFLFWELSGTFLIENKKTYTFYKFINIFNEKQINENEKIEAFESQVDNYIAVLDGQQRITALNIAINGWIEAKKNKYGRNSDITKKILYINIINSPKKEKEDDELYYEMEFIREEEKEYYENKYWRPLNEIRNINPDYIETYIKNIKIPDKDILRAYENIKHITDIFNDPNRMPHYLIRSEDMDMVLELFVRVNSGGQVLQKSDLLFSTIIASWDGGREEIDKLIDTINRKEKGGIFKFNIDYIMRTCLYLLDKSLDMKVGNFKKDNTINDIMSKWNNIKEAIENTVDFLEERKFNDSNITSYNAIMPIIYYIYKGGNYKDLETKNELYKYFVIAQLKQVFGGASNSTLKDVRKALVIDENKFELKSKKFRLIQLNEVSSGVRNFIVDKKVIESWFQFTKGQYTYLVLSLLLKGLDNGTNYHQDHMHPDAILKNNEEFKAYKDKLANIQLIPAPKNLRKSKEELKDWIKESEDNIPQECPKDDRGNYIYTETKAFLDFYKARREILMRKLFNIFGFEYDDQMENNIKNEID